MNVNSYQVVTTPLHSLLALIVALVGAAAAVGVPFPAGEDH